MDRYLEAIEKDEGIKLDFIDKKEILKDKRDKAKRRKEYLECDNEDYQKRIDEALRLRDYHKNKDTYKKSFLKKSLKFGIKSMFVFLIMILIFVLSTTKIDPTYVLNVSALIQGNIVVGTLMALIEYASVSRDFRSLIGKRSNEENESFIIDAKAKTEDNISLKNQLELIISDLCVDIYDVETAIIELEYRILDYRTKRNSLIESIIQGLDNHIERFKYEEFDIDKIKKRTSK